MSGVFLSYSRSDRAFVDQIVRGLRAVGVEVWWDEDMPGVDWQDELERQISELVGVVVLWTEHSAASSNVRDEARLGLKIGKLINVLSGVAEPPFPFDRVNGLPLDGWNGLQPHHGWTRLVQTVEALVVRAGGCQPGDITGAQTRRESALRDQQDALARAQSAFQDAQMQEGDASESAKAAAAALARAEDDMGRVGEMRVSLTILRSAQQELEAAREAKLAADEGLRAAKARLSETSVVLARLKADMDRLVSEAVKPSVGSAAERPPHAQNVLHLAAERLAEAEADTPVAADAVQTKPADPSPPPRPSPPSPPPSPPTPPTPPVPPPTPARPPAFDQTGVVPPTVGEQPAWRRYGLIAVVVAIAIVGVIVTMIVASRHPRPVPAPVIPDSGSPASNSPDSGAPAIVTPTPAPNADSVSGTTWQGVYTWSSGEVETETDTFRPDGVLVYSYKGQTFDNGHWSQVGDTVNWDSNNHYADGVGQVQGNQITGAMTNVAKATGTFTLTRQP